MKKLLFILFSFPMIGLTQELITENIMFDGNNRQYTAYIPEIYSPSTPNPILMAFHGGAGYAQDFMSYEADFRSIADTAWFILVYPQALEDPNNENNDLNGWYYPVSEINNYWATVNNTDLNPSVIELPDINISDGSQVERYSWENGEGCVSVEELKIINGRHDWPSPLSFWANQDINANTEIWDFVSKYNINGLIDCNNLSVETENIDNKRELMKIINVFGQEVNIPNQRREVLFYVYNDGSVQKKINF